MANAQERLACLDLLGNGALPSAATTSTNGEEPQMHDTILPGAGRPASISIPRLRAAFNGRVIAPDDPGYDQARTVFWAASTVGRRSSSAPPTPPTSRGSSRSRARPGWNSPSAAAATAPPATASPTGASCSTSRTCGALDIDPQQRTAWAQTGLTAGEYTTAAGAHGLATGFGDTGSVGIGGITLGGGVGYLVRKHGLTIDDLLAAELVTADGSSCAWTTRPTPTCSGRSGAAAATSASRPGSSSACTRSTRSWAAS